MDKTGVDDDNFWELLKERDTAQYVRMRERRRLDDEMRRLDEERAAEERRVKPPLFLDDRSKTVKIEGLEGKRRQASPQDTDMNEQALPKMRPNDSAELTTKLELDTKNEQSIALSKERDEVKKRKPTDSMDDTDLDEKEMKSLADWQKLATPHLLFDDWVPDKPVRQSNGGFGKTKDNGRPVPYKMNGHIEIQRKFPWEADN